MKNILPLLFIALASSVTNAEDGFEIPGVGRAGHRAIVEQAEAIVTSEIVLAKNEANNLPLWKALDSNRDDSISKTEAAYSEAIFNRWGELDANKDNELDYIEFSRFSNQGQGSGLFGNLEHE